MARPKTAMRVRAAVSAIVLGLSCGLSHATDVSGAVTGRWSARQNPIHVVGDCVVPADQSLSIGPGTVVQIDAGASIVVSGSLAAYGSVVAPVVISASTPDTPWRCLRVTEGGFAVLTNAAVSGGGAADPRENTGMLRVDGGSLRLSSVTVQGSASSGIFLNGGQFAASSCRFSSTGGSQPTDAAIHVVTGFVELGAGADANSITTGVWGIYNEDIEPVVATGTWWGSATGPQHPDNVHGTGSSVSDDVVFDDYVTVNPFALAGDVNRDGAVNIADVVALLETAGGLHPLDNLTGADVNGDGVADTADAIRLLRAVLGTSPLVQ